MKHCYIYLDDKLKEVEVSFQNLLRPGVLWYDGVFETMRAYGGEIYALDLHVDRLKIGLKHFHITANISRKKIAQKIEKILRVYKCKNARIRVAIWRDDQRIRQCIVCVPIKNSMLHKQSKGYVLGLSPFKISTSRNTNIKALKYNPFYFAREYARQKDFDEVVLMNNNKKVVEGSHTNIFMVKNSRLITPPLKDGALNGITRHSVLRLAKSMHIACQVKSITPKMLKSADEIFVTNSIIELMPVVSFEQRKISQGNPGETTLALLTAYKQQITADQIK